MGNRLGLSALVVFLSLIFWSWMWGPIGMLLSVPLTVVVKIVFEHIDDLRPIAVLLGPEGEGFKTFMRTLDGGRVSIAALSLGIAQGAYELALDYVQQREQFDRPIARFQLVQNKLVWMVNEITKAQLLCWRLAKLKESGKLHHSHVSLAKRNNCWMALETCRKARDLLGANGITDEYQVMRHMCNLESVITYEGTHDIHALIVGKEITGEDAIA